MSANYQTYIKRATVSKDNITITTLTSTLVQFSIDSNIHIVGISHVALSNATTSGTLASSCNVYNISITSSNVIQVNIRNDKSDTAYIKLEVTYMYTD